MKTENTEMITGNIKINETQKFGLNLSRRLESKSSNKHVAFKTYPFITLRKI